MDLADDSVTILKYKMGEAYGFHVMDKNNEKDEVKRLDNMIEYSKAMAELQGELYEELWIKTCPIFATKG